MKRGFTLIELIVVIIIVGILAALGITQYSKIVEKSRLAEAKIRIGTMRQLAYEYYLTNRSMIGINSSYVGAEENCTPTDFYSYFASNLGSSIVLLMASRCTSGGKTPNASLAYYYTLQYIPSSGWMYWTCAYDDGSSCFGLPP